MLLLENPYPRYKNLSLHKDRPRLLDNLINFIELACIYYKKYLPAIGFLTRARKLQRLQAIGAVSRVLLHYTCLKTGRISKGNHSGCYIPISLAEIAHHANLPQSTVSRALKDLNKAGYLGQIYRRIKKSSGGFFSLIALRRFNRKFLNHLGFSDREIEKARHWKIKKEKQEHRIEPKIKLSIAEIRKDIESEDMVKLRKLKYPQLTILELLRLADKNNMPIYEFLNLPTPEPPS